MTIALATQSDDVQKDIWEKVSIAFQEALGLDEDEVEFDMTIIEDLDAESLDLLDITFQLERSFDISIPRGGIQKTAQEGADNDGLQSDGTLTDNALVRLAEAMPEIPKEKFVQGLKPNDIPNLFVVGTFYNLVVRLLNEK
ncbi:MAG: acyl carrier protein [Deltaproteobacteria bacterium]|nr:acyl carrier protein [Deltaproteobacteria bacterium]